MRKILLTICLFLLASPAWCATNAWTTGGVDTKWSTAGNWSLGHKPAAGEDVTMGDVSDQNCTLDENTANLNSLDMNGYSGTLETGATPYFIIVKPASGTVTVRLGGTVNLAGGGNAGIALAPATGATINFYQNSATFSAGDLQVGSTTGGTFNGTVYFLDNVSIASIRQVNFVIGTLHTDGASDNSGLTHSWGLFSSSNTSTRAFNLGNSTINMTGASVAAWECGNYTALTVTAGTSTINLTGTAASFNGGTTKTYNNVNFTASGSTALGSCIIVNLHVTGTNVKTDRFRISGNPTVTGEFHVEGNSITNRLLVNSSTLGTARTLTLSGATITTNNIDVGDITFQPAASTGKTVTGVADDGTGKARFATTTAHGLSVNQHINSTVTGYTGIKTVTVVSDTTHFDTADVYAATGTGAWTYDLTDEGANLIGDCGGNTGGNFTAATTQTYTDDGNSDNWDLSTVHGAWTSHVPLPQDTVVISGTATKTLTANMPRLGKDISFTTATNFTNNTISTLYGSLNFTNAGTIAGTGITMESWARTGTLNLTSAGKSFATNLTFDTIGATILLMDNLSVPSGNLTLSSGNFDNSSGYNVTTGKFPSNVTVTRVVNLGNGTYTLTGSDSATLVWMWNSSGLTFDAGGSKIVLSNTSSTAKTFQGQGLRYNNLSTPSGTGGVAITGANTFNQITVAAGGKLTLPSTVTNIVADFVATGSSGSTITLLASTGGSAATLTKTGGGELFCDYCSITDSTVGGTDALWTARNSTNVSGNTGWRFQKKVMVVQ